jgi:hypothetical protein
MKKLFVFAICAVGLQIIAKAQTNAPQPAITNAAGTQSTVTASGDIVTVPDAQVQTPEKKQCAGAAKACSGASATKSCCKAKATQTAASAEKKSCCKDKAAAAGSCKGHETSASGEKKSCAKPCCKKAEN